MGTVWGGLNSKKMILARRLGMMAMLAALALAGCQRGELGDVGSSAGGSIGAFGGIAAHAVWPEGSVPSTTGFRTFNSTPIPSAVVSIRLSVTDGSGSFQRSETFVVATTTGRSGTVTNVPVGSGRILTIEALDGTDVVLYSGSSPPMIVKAGETADAGDVALSLATAGSGAIAVTNPPVASPYYSNDSVLVSNKLTVSGTCSVSAGNSDQVVVAVLGGVDQNTPVACTTGSFSLQIPKPGGDASYTYQFELRDAFNGAVTHSATWEWRIDNSESAVSLNPPGSATTGGLAVTITGSCNSGSLVSSVAADTDELFSNACTSGGTFSVDMTRSVGDGEFEYDVYQTDKAGNDSTPVVFTWTIDSTVPATPTITTPTSNPYYKNTLTTIGGACVDGYAVNLSGQATASQTCGATVPGAYSFTVTDPGSDAQFTYTVKQTNNVTGITSAGATLTFNRDSVAAAPSIDDPSVASGATYTGPWITGSTSLPLAGTCEVGATVTMTGAVTSPKTATCASDGTYSITADGVSLTDYALALKQTDLAGNVSGNTTLNWRPDLSVPSTPVITGPATNPYYAQSLTAVSGTCTDGYTVNLTGQVTASMTCGASVSGNFSFTVADPGTDGTYTYTVKQTNTSTSIESAGVTLTFNRDTAVSAPGITTPAGGTVTNSLSSISITGTCEANGTVHITGAASQDLTCTSGGAFSHTDNQSSDNSYVYSITQTDRAGNTSSAATVTWNRQTAPAAPVITLPAAEPYYSNTSLSTLAGTCTPGMRVDLSGDDTAFATCSGAGTFAFTLSGQLPNNTYAYDVIQTNTNTGLFSSTVTRTWIYDTNAPSAPALDSSVVTSNNGSINITGTCETGTTVYLVDITGAGVGNQSTLCTGGTFSFTVSQSVTGTFQYQVSQTDNAGNSSTTSNAQWNRPAPGYTVTPTSGLSTNENGTTASFTVVLQSTPNGNVVVDVASGDTTEGTVDKSSLTFNAGNWSSPQTVTVTGVDDLIVDGNQTYLISLSTNTGSTTDSTGYKLINPPNVSVTNADNDAVGVTVTPTSGLVVSESGTQTTFTVVLNTQPNGNVVINVTSQDTSEILVGASAAVQQSSIQLTFNAANWSTAQTVWLTGVDDALDDGNQTVTIQLAMNTGLTTDTTGYAGVNPADVVAVNADDDTAGFTVTPTTGLITTESGGKATFTVTMNTSPNPGETVVLDVASNDTSEVSVDKSQLTFTSLDWYVPQTVTLTGVDDAVQDGNQTTTIALTVNQTLTTDTTGYKLLTPPAPSVINIDDDQVGVTVNPTTLTTSENGSEAEFIVRLNTQPTGTVVILVQNSNASEISVDKTDLTFTAADWQTPQHVRVTGKPDALADGNKLVNIALIMDTSLTTDLLYKVLDPADVAVTNLDNTDAVTVTPTTGLQTNDSGGTAQFTAVLNTQPDTGTVVVVDVTSLNTAEVTSNKSQLTFDENNWSTAQTVTLTGHANTGGSAVVTIQLAVNTGLTTDAGYATVDAPDVSVTNIHSNVFEVVVNPTSGHVTSESGASSSFTVTLTSQPAANVTVAITSNDTTEVTVDKGTLTFTPADWATSQTVTMKGVNDSLTDGDIATSITVHTTSTDPLYSGLADQTVNVTNLDNEPTSQGSVATPVNLGGVIPYDGTTPSSASGSSYYKITGLTAGTTYLITLSSLVNPATLYVYTDSAYTTLSCTGNQNSGDSRPKSCQSQPNASGELYIKVTSNSASAGATFKIDVVVAPVSEGSSASPINLTYASLPYDLGQVASGNSWNSYYKITGVPASQAQYVRITSITANLDLFVYSNSGFSTLLCSSTASSIAEACNANVPANGTIYVRVLCSNSAPSCQTGEQKATFDLSIVNPPANQGASGSPLDVTPPYSGTAINNSYYRIINLTPGTSYTVSLTEVTSGVSLNVYSDVNFSTQLCSSANAVNLPESCTATANASGRLYVRASNGGTATTFTVRVQ